MEKNSKDLIEVKEVSNNKASRNSSKPEETENFATEIFKAFNAQSSFVVRGLIIGWAASVAIGASVGAALYVWNDQKWRDLFNSYDYISQDGEGINNINSGEQGNLDNNPDAE